VRCTVGRDTPVTPPPTHSDWPWALGGCVVRRRAAVRAMATIADARAGAKASEIADARPVGPTCVRGATRGRGGSIFPGARQSLMACPTAQGVQRSCTPSRQAAPTHAGKRETHASTHTAWGGVEGGVEHQQFCALSTRRLRGLGDGSPPTRTNLASDTTFNSATRRVRSRPTRPTEPLHPARPSTPPPPDAQFTLRTCRCRQGAAPLPASSSTSAALCDKPCGYDRQATPLLSAR